MQTSYHDAKTDVWNVPSTISLMRVPTVIRLSPSREQPLTQFYDNLCVYGTLVSLVFCQHIVEFKLLFRTKNPHCFSVCGFSLKDPNLPFFSLDSILYMYYELKCAAEPLIGILFENLCFIPI